MGGSALTQLKSSLRASGLSRTSSPKDAKKRKQARKDLSSASLAHRQAKMEDIGKQFNKFDMREEKKKFQVVTRQGRLEEGKKGAPSKSRQAGVELRKMTLLPMLEARSHTSTFVDRRFGENSSNLTPEEKALERFTAERQSRLGPTGKKARFNLEDGDDEEVLGEEGLTHGGNALLFGDNEELEAGGWGGLGDAVAGGASSTNREPLLRRRMAQVNDDEDDDQDEQPERKRSKAEIMDEVVLKAKTHKFERQKIRSADDETRHALDAELKDLRALLSGAPAQSAEKPAPLPQNGTKHSSDDDDSEDDEEAADNDDDVQDGESDKSSDAEESDSEENSDSEGSTYELNDEELEAALSAANSKSGVDREVLRKLIGGAADEQISEPTSKEIAPESVSEPEFTRPNPTLPAPALITTAADPYDSYVRMLAIEPRGKPSDRLRTPLEIAQDAAEDLRKQEEKRLKRQRGEADDDEEDDEDVRAKNKLKKGKRLPQADDLEDDYFKEDSENELEGQSLGTGLEEKILLGGDSEQEEDSDNEDDDDEDAASEGESEEGSSEEFDDEEIDLSESEQEFDSTAPESLVASAQADEIASAPARKWGNQDIKKELPFTFPCPSTHSEFLKLLESSGISSEETVTVVKRIRTLYHPQLGPENKEKLQIFTNVLLDHVIYLAVKPDSRTFSTINSILPSLLTLSHAFPLTTAPHYVTKLGTMQKNLVKGLSSDALLPASVTWPGLPELVLLRLVGIVWSTSDLSHPVAAAAMLLIAQYLAQARIRNLSDLSAGLFLCSLVSQYEQKSQRFVPEALNFLLNAILILLPSGLTLKTLPGNFPAPDFAQEHVKLLKLKPKENPAILELNPNGKIDLLASLSTKTISAKGSKGLEQAQLKVDLCAMAIRLLDDFRAKYTSLEAYVEIFRPVEIILTKIGQKTLPTALKTQIDTLKSSLTRSLNFSTESRRPLTLQHHKPIPIATFIPKFDEGFNPNKRFDPDTERNEAAKLKALFKKEKKGAVRELRKDNKFLAGEEAKRKRAQDEIYQTKIKKIMGGLADERGEEKSYNKLKAGIKKADKKRSSRR